MSTVARNYQDIELFLDPDLFCRIELDDCNIMPLLRKSLSEMKTNLTSSHHDVAFFTHSRQDSPNCVRVSRL